MHKKIYSGLLLILGLITLLVACSGEQNANINGHNNNNDDNNNENEPEEVKEEITFTLMMWDDMGQDYGKYIKEAVEDEFPHITLENLPGNTAPNEANKERIEDAIADGIVPDLMFSSRQSFVG